MSEPKLSTCCHAPIDLYFPTLTVNYWICGACHGITDREGNALPPLEPATQETVRVQGRPVTSAENEHMALDETVYTFQVEMIKSQDLKIKELKQLLSECSGMLKLLYRDKPDSQVILVNEVLDRIVKARNS